MMYFDLDAELRKSLPQFARFTTSRNEETIMQVQHIEKKNRCQSSAVFRKEADAGYRFSLNKYTAKTDEDFRRVRLYGDTPNSNAERKLVSDLLLDIFRYRAIMHNGILAHGAVTVFNNQAIMFSGLSGAGKSTQANLWHAEGAWILNYDKPVIWFDDNNRVYVAGTPWSGKEHCYVNSTIPLICIIFVVQAPWNKLRRLGMAEAYSKIYPNYMLYPINEGISEKYEHFVEELVTSVPIYELACTATSDAVEHVMQELKIDSRAGRRRIKMKAKAGFTLKNIAGEYILIPRGAHALKYNATILFNSTGAFLWEYLSSHDNCSINQLTGALLQEFSVSYEQAEQDVQTFVSNMQKAGIVE